MNNAKHTPGPWTATKVVPEKYLSGYRGSTYYAIKANGSRIAQTSGEHLTQDTEANAHLIAAAPELLAIVKRLSTMFPSGEGLGGYAPKEAFAAIGTQARAAIAKATGQE